MLPAPRGPWSVPSTFQGQSEAQAFEGTPCAGKAGPQTSHGRVPGRASVATVSGWPRPPRSPPPELHTEQSAMAASLLRPCRVGQVSVRVADPPLASSSRPPQIARLRSELDIVRGNTKVMSEMLTEMVPGQEDSSDLELLQVRGPPLGGL